MHFWSVNKGGSTLFCPLNEIVQALGDKERQLWDSLFFVGDSSVHPFVYPHPSTGRATLCFHLGDPFFRCFAKDIDWEKNTMEPLPKNECEAIRSRLISLLEDKTRMLEIEWEVGDLAVIDNLAIGHFASSGTQGSRKDTGLRILHRVTVSGKANPLELKNGMSDRDEKAKE
mmetsp:Transcript_28230/g.54889  ORF Transcript_28230/g.54889 Transcript_28230/m.54889 type:complete len:172 (-) Transcript_28230:54-569(-)